MRIFRLEKDGNGVFSDNTMYEVVAHAVLSRGLDNWPEIESFDGSISPWRHPDPHEDVPGFSSDERFHELYCGFESYEQLIKWFDSEAIREALNATGVELLEYECDVDHVLIGKHQVVFRKHLASIIRTSSIPTLDLSLAGKQTE